MQVCPELEMAVLSLTQFMPAEYQLEAAKRIVEVYEQWLWSESNRTDVQPVAASLGAPMRARSPLVTDADFTEVAPD